MVLKYFFVETGSMVNFNVVEFFIQINHNHKIIFYHGSSKRQI